MTRLARPPNTAIIVGGSLTGLATAIQSPPVFTHSSLPMGPSWDEVRRLLAMTESDRPIDIRDRAVLMLLAIYGLRTDEVRLLRLEDLDWENESIRGMARFFGKRLPRRVRSLHECRCGPRGCQHPACSSLPCRNRANHLDLAYQAYNSTHLLSLCGQPGFCHRIPASDDGAETARSLRPLHLFTRRIASFGTIR